jgi:hypothetical protein
MAVRMIFMLVKADSTLIKSAHSNGSGYPLNGCFPAVPLSVSPDLTKVNKLIFSTTNTKQIPQSYQIKYLDFILRGKRKR